MDLQFGRYRLNRVERQVLGPEGPLTLSARSFDILALLLERPNVVVGKTELFETVWPGVVVEDNTLQVHVSALRKVLDAKMIMTVHGRGYKYAGPSPVGLDWAAKKVRPMVPMNAPGKPVIAVLPFSNLSADAEQQYFSDGISRDIADRLSRYPILSIIGWHSASMLQNPATVLEEARDKLGADYVLAGDVRKSNGRVRISARLIEARSGTTKWADHYDRPLSDIFQIQDEVAAVIASTLMGRVELDVGARSLSPGDRAFLSYELVLQGIWHYKKLNRSATIAAGQCFDQAIAIHPANAEAHRYLAIVYMDDWWSNFIPEALPRALKTALRAVEIDPASASCHQALSTCRLWAESLGSANMSNTTARELNPGDPDILVQAGIIAVYAGDLAAAADYFDRAFKLNPLPPRWYPAFRALGDFAKADYAEALTGFEAIKSAAFETIYVLACLGHLGRIETARSIRERLLSRGRNLDFMSGAAREPYVDPSAKNRLIEGLQKALEL